MKLLIVISIVIVVSTLVYIGVKEGVFNRFLELIRTNDVDESTATVPRPRPTVNLTGQTEAKLS